MHRSPTESGKRHPRPRKEARREHRRLGAHHRIPDEYVLVWTRNGPFPADHSIAYRCPTRDHGEVWVTQYGVNISTSVTHWTPGNSGSSMNPFSAADLSRAASRLRKGSGAGGGLRFPIGGGRDSLNYQTS